MAVARYRRHYLPLCNVELAAFGSILVKEVEIENWSSALGDKVGKREIVLKPCNNWWLRDGLKQFRQVLAVRKNELWKMRCLACSGMTLF